MFAGSCHCGALRVELHTELALAELSIRECQCSFCRRHAARTTTDSKGTVHLYKRADLAPYRFGRQVTDVHVCDACGVYVAATCVIDGMIYATVNTNTFDPRPTQLATPVAYDAESTEARLARRARTWSRAEIQLQDSLVRER
jgi:hypothetical protein